MKDLQAFTQFRVDPKIDHPDADRDLTPMIPEYLGRHQTAQIVRPFDRDRLEHDGDFQVERQLTFTSFDVRPIRIDLIIFCVPIEETR